MFAQGEVQDSFRFEEKELASYWSCMAKTNAMIFCSLRVLELVKDTFPELALEDEFQIMPVGLGREGTGQDGYGRDQSADLEASAKEQLHDQLAYVFGDTEDKEV
ncbi:hypothetical protein EDD11_004527 [Mortierella claussenii]|nr:hypothetical protein EDD11_004527 [Mortierella claussenii]